MDGEAQMSDGMLRKVPIRPRTASLNRKRLAFRIPACCLHIPSSWEESSIARVRVLHELEGGCLKDDGWFGRERLPHCSKFIPEQILLSALKNRPLRSSSCLLPPLSIYSLIEQKPKETNQVPHVQLSNASLWQLLTFPGTVFFPLSCYQCNPRKLIPSVLSYNTRSSLEENIRYVAAQRWRSSMYRGVSGPGINCLHWPTALWNWKRGNCSHW